MFIAGIIMFVAPDAGWAQSVAEMEVLPAQAVRDDLWREWGVQILGIRRAAAGYMLDFRYRVLDADKAAPLFDRKTHPYLIDQATGAKFGVPNPPKTGPLRTSDNPKANRNYFIFFSNPGKYVKPGSLVTVVIGEFKVENLVVN